METARQKKNEWSRNYYRKNREKILRQRAVWKANNKERLAELERARTRRWREKNPDYKKGHHLLIRYGLSKERYAEMVEEQNGVCKICARVCPTGQRLSVDHDHESGEIRGLLCRTCNFVLGYMNDDPALLEAAARYLRDSIAA